MAILFNFARKFVNFTALGLNRKHLLNPGIKQLRNMQIRLNSANFSRQKSHKISGGIQIFYRWNPAIKLVRNMLIRQNSANFSRQKAEKLPGVELFVYTNTLTFSFNIPFYSIDRVYYINLE